MLGTFHYLADVRGANRWTTVFLWLGANAITIYLMNNILDFSRLALRLAGGDVGSFFDRYLTYGTGRLVAATVAMAMAILLARFLYRRRIFLRV